MADLTISLQAGVYHLSGRIDERSDLAVLEKAGPAAVILNLQALEGMNSIGTKKFLMFVRARGARPLTFRECPRWFVDMANVLPDTVGGPRRGDRIESVYVPFSCEGCKTPEIELLLSTTKVVVTDRGVDVLAPRCTTCRQAQKVGMDPQDYFLFLIEARREVA